jgi:hypothetical protein
VKVLDDNERESALGPGPSRFRRTSLAQKGGAAVRTTEAKGAKFPSQRTDSLVPGNEPRIGRLDMAPASRYRTHSRSRSRSTRGRSLSPGARSFDVPSDEESEGDEEEQDIEELWFPGGHADIGGGWKLKEGEIPLAHLPLVWIVLEARKCGLQFDEEKMRMMGCLDDSEDFLDNEVVVPKIEVSGSPGVENGAGITMPGTGARTGQMSFRDRILHCATKSLADDCLAFGQGLPTLGVLSWQIMEWIPFMRMDLRDNGS